MSLPAGLSMIANPLLNGDNNVNTILDLPDAASGAIIFRFDTETQNYGQPIQFVGFGLGWISTEPDPDWLVLEPGEGFFIQLAAAQDVTFVGDVPQGNLSNPVPGANNLSIRSSQVPQEAALGKAADAFGDAVGLEFPSTTGDTVFLFDQGTQNYTQPYQYIDGLGWVDNEQGGIITDGPVIPVGVSFFVQKSGDLSQNWTRTFSVN
jgi:hypothetical protein